MEESCTGLLSRQARWPTIAVDLTNHISEATRLAERFLGELILNFQCFHADFSFCSQHKYTKHRSSPE